MNADLKLFEYDNKQSGKTSLMVVINMGKGVGTMVKYASKKWISTLRNKGVKIGKKRKVKRDGKFVVETLKVD